MERARKPGDEEYSHEMYEQMKFVTTMDIIIISDQLSIGMNLMVVG